MRVSMPEGPGSRDGVSIRSYVFGSFPLRGLSLRWRVGDGHDGRRFRGKSFFYFTAVDRIPTILQTWHGALDLER
jgi:hypothetical protein